jgi:FtsH-binding integral membrane protein
VNLSKYYFIFGFALVIAILYGIIALTIWLPALQPNSLHDLLIDYVLVSLFLIVPSIAMGVSISTLMNPKQGKSNRIVKSLALAMAIFFVLSAVLLIVNENVNSYEQLIEVGLVIEANAIGMGKLW